jgi:hypothetical protein
MHQHHRAASSIGATRARAKHRVADKIGFPGVADGWVEISVFERKLWTLVDVATNRMDGRETALLWGIALLALELAKIKGPTATAGNLGTLASVIDE